MPIGIGNIITIKILSIVGIDNIWIGERGL